MPMYVPLITVNVQPRKNADRPAIELTTRSCQCPTYEVALIKAVWGKLHAETITEVPLIDGVNPLYELLPRDGLSALATEEMRLRNKYRKVYNTVYRDGEIEKLIMACVKDANVFVDQVAARDAEAQEAGAERAAMALMKASGQAVTRAKAGPGRPRKNPQFKNPEDASVEALPAAR